MALRMEVENKETIGNNQLLKNNDSKLDDASRKSIRKRKRSTKHNLEKQDQPLFSNRGGKSRSKKPKAETPDPKAAEKDRAMLTREGILVFDVSNAKDFKTSVSSCIKTRALIRLNNKYNLVGNDSLESVVTDNFILIFPRGCIKDGYIDLTNPSTRQDVAKRTRIVKELYNCELGGNISDREFKNIPTLVSLGESLLSTEIIALSKVKRSQILNACKKKEKCELKLLLNTLKSSAQNSANSEPSSLMSLQAVPPQSNGSSSHSNSATSEFKFIIPTATYPNGERKLSTFNSANGRSFVPRYTPRLFSGVRNPVTRPALTTLLQPVALTVPINLTIHGYNPLLPSLFLGNNIAQTHSVSGMDISTSEILPKKQI